MHRTWDIYAQAPGNTCADSCNGIKLNQGPQDEEKAFVESILGQLKAVKE